MIFKLAFIKKFNKFDVVLKITKTLRAEKKSMPINFEGTVKKVLDTCVSLG